MFPVPFVITESPFTSGFFENVNAVLASIFRALGGGMTRPCLARSRLAQLCDKD